MITTSCNLCCTGGTRSVGSAAVRSSRLRRAELRSGRWTFRSSLRSDLHVHRPTLRICPPSPFLTLSAPPRSLGQKAVPGTVSQSLDVICAVSAQAPSALLYRGHSLGRERCRSFVKATQGRTTLRTVDVPVFATLRPTRPPPYASHLPSFAFPHTLCAPSVARSKSGTRHCFTEPGRYLCGVGASAVRFGKTPFLLAIARSETLVAPSGRSAAFLLPRFSPSLATLGHLPPGGFMCLFGMCVPPFRHRLRRSLHIGTHEKRLGPFLCGVGYALRRALSEHVNENRGAGTPISPSPLFSFS